MLHEAIPITGSLVSGTYGGVTVALGSEPHVKNYSHGMFQSVYDYPYLSSSANHIFDIAIGLSSKGQLYSDTTSQQAKKANIYNQMAQVLMGHDVTGSIQEFDEDGNILAGGTKLREVFFLNFARLLAKDEVKKGSFQLELGVEGSFSQALNGSFTKRIKLTDASGSDGYFVNSPAGEYGILYAQSTADNDGDDTDAIATFNIANETAASTTHPAVGLIFYQAGIAVVSGSVFGEAARKGILHDSNTASSWLTAAGGAIGLDIAATQTIETCCNAIRNRIYNLSFNNSTELNSSIYFCRINHNDFNYSSNPSYLSGSKLRVKNSTIDNPVTYLTTIGLYSADNELLAVAKLSEPIKKDPSTEMTLRVRLDY
jgi:hypothetical protein